MNKQYFTLSVDGADKSALCQVPNLRRGFINQGHYLADWKTSQVDFVFCGNPWFDELINAKSSKILRTQLIFNVLDIPEHIRDFPIQKLLCQLSKSDAVTCISEFVSSQLKKHGINSEVIYYPMKPVFYTGLKKHPFKVLACGRVNDPNKYFASAVHALIRAGYKEEDVVIVGGENPGWGTFLGTVSDETLNELMNSVDYVIMLSKIEGIGLPAIEGAVCGAIPILASHLSTLPEFWSESPLGLQYAQSNSVAAVADLMIAIDSDPNAKTQLKKAFRQYANDNFLPKFSPDAVASRIIDVYRNTPTA